MTAEPCGFGRQKRGKKFWGFTDNEVGGGRRVLGGGAFENDKGGEMTQEKILVYEGGSGKKEGIGSGVGL